jgi:hypothetical protein
MSRLEKLERASLAVAVVAGLLGLAAGSGLSPLPRAPAAWAWGFAPLLVVLGAAVGVAAMRRGAEIDRQRWELVNDPLSTKDLRQATHKEAERRRNTAGTLFLLGPLLLGFWLSQQLEPGAATATLGVALAPLLGFFAGLLWGRRYDR